MEQPLTSDVSVPLGQTLWTPSDEFRAGLNLTKFAAWVSERQQRDLSAYPDLWQWSVDDLPGFWSSIAEYFELGLGGESDAVLSDDPMPRTAWFPGATVNFAERALGGDGARTALVVMRRDDEDELTLDELRDQVARAAEGLRRRGVVRGDAVASYLPNCVEAAVLLLACASIGAVYTSCTIEFGAPLVVDRLSMLSPKVLVAGDGYRHHEKVIDRREAIEEIASSLPSLEAVVVVPVVHESAEGNLGWSDFTADIAELEFEPVPFDHPLYILYSSGTTGRPKAFVHAHGRMLIEHVKLLSLQMDLRPGDRLLQPTTTSWMLWNLGVSALLLDIVPVFYDGDPLYPDSLEIWRAVSRSNAAVLNCGSGIVLAAMRDGRRPKDYVDLSSLRTVSVTGSPYPPEGFAWIYEAVKDDVFVISGSGGTDLCTAVQGGVPSVPVTAGELSAPFLGVAVDSFNEAGEPVRDEDGELVVTRPMPSMPVALVGDTDYSRYESSYFAKYPGVWCHGDWIRIRETGEAVITGRSDATLNRGGVRIGTSEVYTLLEQDPRIRDCVIVHLDSGDSDQLVMVVTTSSPEVDPVDLEASVRRAVRRDLSPRHVPDRVFVVSVLPRTLTGKRLEVPVKRILSGTDPSAALDPEAITGAEALPELVAIADALNGAPEAGEPPRV